MYPPPPGGTIMLMQLSQKSAMALPPTRMFMCDVQSEPMMVAFPSSVVSSSLAGPLIVVLPCTMIQPTKFRLPLIVSEPFTTKIPTPDALPFAWMVTSEEVR